MSPLPPPDEAPDDERRRDLWLRERLLAGEPDVAEEFLGRHLDSLYEFVNYRIGRERSATEDLVQDVLLVALQRIADYDGRASLHSWLCGIARNKLRERRRERRAVPIEDLLEDADQDIERILADVERTPLPESILEARETSELVGAALSSLPPEYRAALIAKYVEGLSVAQVALRLGKNHKSTESTLTRARSAFGRVLALLAKKRGEGWA